MTSLWRANMEKYGAPPHWFLIQIKAREVFAIVHTFDGEWMYWNYGPGGCPFDADEYRVIWYFGQADDRISHVLDDARLAILMAEPLRVWQPGDAPSYGFISPGGEYYLCDFEGHSALALRIVAHKHSAMLDEVDAFSVGQRFLETHGYVTVMYKIVTCFADTITGAQRAIAERLKDDPKFGEGFTHLLDQFDERPKPKLIEPPGLRRRRIE